MHNAAWKHQTHAALAVSWQGPICPRRKPATIERTSQVTPQPGSGVNASLSDP
ncbi:hypothetical protein fugu_009827, partial [Takifugu bimaculatus]